MADREKAESLDTDAKVRRGVRRTLVNWIVALVSLGVVIAWGSQAFYFLELGDSAVILRLGKYERVETKEGLNWHWPPPIEYHTTVRTAGVRSQEFGMREPVAAAVEPEHEAKDPTGRPDVGSNTIQTADSNIVIVAYELQYAVEDPYSFEFGMADGQGKDILHDATQAAVRDVIGHKTIDAVLSSGRREIEREAEKLLKATLQSYFGELELGSAFSIEKVNLQMVQPPPQAREAFDDVVSAQQDEVRLVSLARGDAQEILEKARGEAAEIEASAEAYRTAKVVEAEGEATRFEALLVEYQRAPKVTRERLYLETMEQILPSIEKVVVEPDTVNMFPTLPSVGSGPARSGPAGSQPSGSGEKP